MSAVLDRYEVLRFVRKSSPPGSSAAAKRSAIVGVLNWRSISSMSNCVPRGHGLAGIERQPEAAAHPGTGRGAGGRCRSPRSGRVSRSDAGGHGRRGRRTVRRGLDPEAERRTPGHGERRPDEGGDRALRGRLDHPQATNLVLAVRSEDQQDRPRDRANIGSGAEVDIRARDLLDLSLERCVLGHERDREGETREGEERRDRQGAAHAGLRCAPHHGLFPFG